MMMMMCGILLCASIYCLLSGNWKYFVMLQVGAVSNSHEVSSQVCYSVSNPIDNERFRPVVTFNH